MPRNKQKYNDYMRSYYTEKKIERIKKLGGKCVVCGETKMEFLSVLKRKGEKARVICWNDRLSKFQLTNKKRIKVEQIKK